MMLEPRVVDSSPIPARGRPIRGGHSGDDQWVRSCSSLNKAVSFAPHPGHNGRPMPHMSRPGCEHPVLCTMTWPFCLFMGHCLNALSDACLYCTEEEITNGEEDVEQPHTDIKSARRTNALLALVPLIARTKGAPLNVVNAVMYWMQKRVWTLGNSNSHKTWSASLTWLCQCYGMPSKQPMHQMHSDFAMWFQNVKKSAHCCDPTGGPDGP